MRQRPTAQLEAFRQELAEEYERRFPESKRHYAAHAGRVVDHTSHAIRWNEPFMPVTARAEGACIEDLDGHRIVDYWQGHFANVLGHNPVLIRNALSEALAEGRGLQSGMVHVVEAEVSELICQCTGAEAVRVTTSGSLGTFYASMLARAFTGRERVLKVGGGWHGSQPFGLKGVSAHGDDFDHIESEGLSSSAGREILLTRFNDVEDLRRIFAERGDRIACFLLEPVLGAGGGIPASGEYLNEARRLTAKHGALLICDEIITGFRFRAGDLSSEYSVTPDLWVLGKVLGGGMPVAAVAGRADVLALCSRESGRVKFEGGTYSAHELSLIAARVLMRHAIKSEAALYSGLAQRGRQLKNGLLALAESEGVPLAVLGTPTELQADSSLVMLHVLEDDGPPPSSPEELAARGHPFVGERLLKSVLMLEDVSVRSGVGAVSMAHTQQDVDQTLDAMAAAFERLRRAGLL